jgi:hypothetical protein
MGFIHNLIKQLIGLFMKVGQRYKIIRDGGKGNSPDGRTSFYVNTEDKFVVIRQSEKDPNLFAVRHLGPSNKEHIGDLLMVHYDWSNNHCERIIGCDCDSWELLHYGHMPDCVKK